MSTVADYVGRTIDLAVFHGQQATGEAQLLQALSLPGEGGRVVTGIAKLAQRFLLELLTERGSMLYRPDRGSSFMTEVRSGFVRTQADLLAAFSRGLLDVNRSLAADESETDPPDERYGSSSVINVTLVSDWARIDIALSSLNPAAKTILPIRVIV